MSNTARPKTAGDKLASDEVNRNLPIEATAGETISVASNPIPVYIKDTDGECYKTDASFDDERIHNFVGFAMTAGSDGNAFTLQTHGVVIGFTGLDAGKPYFLSDTAGAISTSVGTQEKMIGIAISATQIWIAPWAYLGLTQKAQTITGIKTFGSIPVLPASDPTSDNQSARKSYVDDHRGLEYVAISKTAWTEPSGGALTWSDLDLSSSIPSGALFIEIAYLVVNGDFNTAGARKNGSALTRYLVTSGRSPTWAGSATVECDSGRVIEIYKGNYSCRFCAIGYWKRMT